MKVAVTYENGEVFQHFGRTPQFNTKLCFLTCWNLRIVEGKK